MLAWAAAAAALLGGLGSAGSVCMWERGPFIMSAK